MKSYGQYCALARALDVVGDRWTLLIVRELLTGPKRYGQLQDLLPGVATNMLADRLRTMEADRLLVRTDGAYVLTDRGRAADGVLQALFEWGVPLMVTGQGDDEFRPGWLTPALDRMYRGATSARRTTVAVRAGGGAATVDVGPDGAEVAPTETAVAHATVVGPPDVVLGVMAGFIEPDDERVTVDGSVAAVRRAASAATRVRNSEPAASPH